MSFDFCPNCRKIIMPKRLSDRRFLLICGCGFSKEVLDSQPLSRSEKITGQKIIGEGVVSGMNEFADYNHTCKKCGFEKAQIIDVGIFYSDEDNLILLKCGKCGFSERIGRKTT
jgi:DNA-directed RNA polymerase subunit M/transcription elongation factor TFIIS